MFFRRKEKVRPVVVNFGMMNNPDYRQEPWKEGLKQRLDFFDKVCLVCGREEDINLLVDNFREEWESKKLVAVYKPWPFPDWSYEELPRHLNEALSLARKQNCDWVVKLDMDTVFHEKDKEKFYKVISKASRKNKWVVSFKKLQFFKPNKYWEKGRLPIAIRSKAPIVYGFEEEKYTDLCQPIIDNGKDRVISLGKEYDIPSGVAIPKNRILKSNKIKLFNYDFTFRTFDRAKELIYQIEIAHARFWGKGYSGLSLENINRDTSMRDYLDLSRDRLLKMNRRMEIGGHPKHFQESLRGLKEGQWGFDLWLKI